MTRTKTRRPQKSVDRAQFRDMCARFAAAEIGPRWRMADRDKIFPRDFYVAAAESGTDRHHRAGRYRRLRARRLRRSDRDGGDGEGQSEPRRLRAGSDVAGSILYDYGSPAQRDIAREVIAGNCLVAITVTEPEAGNDVQNVKTHARRDGNDWIVDGLKSFITLGGDSDVLVTLAQTDASRGRHGMHFFAIDRRSPGVTCSQIETYVNRPAPTYRVQFDSVRVRRAAGSMPASRKS